MLPAAPTRRLSLGRIEQAGRVIDPIFLNTPQFVCDALGDALGCRVALKVETLNPIRCFKGRGSDFLVAQTPPGTQLVCASSGNFGQAMALAGSRRGRQVTVFTSTAANAFKVERIKALGAAVTRTGIDLEEAKAAARSHAATVQARFVEDSRDIETLEGAGTIGLEWLKFPEPLDALLVALGNGAMFNSVAQVFKERSPRTRMIPVQAAAAPAMIESWRLGKPVALARAETIADGIAVRTPIPEALADMTGLVDEAILVREESIVEGMRLLHAHAGLVAEPASAVGVAAVLENPGLFEGRLVGMIVCGSNLSPAQIRQWLS